ncbi:hypothetical protein CDD81_1329 [Ophiocordyceps australis]|uniref:Uncharacterized protein n=1 Tax=Ophiocordyceps australis TaxID=1399860 RepID=A0A2C5Y1F7_9HYPO|nr:hypothetical protein CDD81_1329 [Ophiocordyceps australis]
MAPKTSEAVYCLVPNLRALDTSARELDLASHSWVQPIVIDDDDLMFGGKPLSAWYEEDRRRLSSGSDDGDAVDNDNDVDQHSHSADDENRGRERTRRHDRQSATKSGHHK